jgi:hypothetical protein
VDWVGRTTGGVGATTGFSSIFATPLGCQDMLLLFSLLAGYGIVRVVLPFLYNDMSAMLAAKSYRRSLRRRLATIDYFKYDIKAVL